MASERFNHLPIISLDYWLRLEERFLSGDKKNSEIGTAGARGHGCFHNNALPGPDARSNYPNWTGFVVVVTWIGRGCPGSSQTVVERSDAAGSRRQ